LEVETVKFTFPAAFASKNARPSPTPLRVIVFETGRDPEEGGHPDPAGGLAGDDVGERTGTRGGAGVVMVVAVVGIVISTISSGVVGIAGDVITGDVIFGAAFFAGPLMHPARIIVIITRLITR
jgi:hypothetical protein